MSPPHRFKSPRRWPFWLRWPAQALRWSLALVILFEEWGWEPLSRLLGLLARWPLLRWLEGRIARLPPYAALTLFVLPSLMLVPVKLGALWLLSHGHAGLGLLVIVTAKLAGTAVVARLFSLTRNSLLQLGWFAQGYTRWTDFKARLLASVRASIPWRTAQRLKRRLRRALKKWLHR